MPPLGRGIGVDLALGFQAERAAFPWNAAEVARCRRRCRVAQGAGARRQCIFDRPRPRLSVSAGGLRRNAMSFDGRFHRCAGRIVGCLRRSGRACSRDHRDKDGGGQRPSHAIPDCHLVPTAAASPETNDTRPQDVLHGNFFHNAYGRPSPERANRSYLHSKAISCRFWG